MVCYVHYIFNMHSLFMEFPSKEESAWFTAIYVQSEGVKNYPLIDEPFDEGSKHSCLVF